MFHLIQSRQITGWVEGLEVRDITLSSYVELKCMICVNGMEKKKATAYNLSVARQQLKASPEVRIK